MGPVIRANAKAKRFSDLFVAEASGSSDAVPIFHADQQSGSLSVDIESAHLLRSSPLSENGTEIKDMPDTPFVGSAQKLSVQSRKFHR